MGEITPALRRSLNENLWLTVGRRYLSIFGNVGTIAVLAVLGVTAIGFSFWAQDWIGFKILGVAAVVLLPVAAIAVLRDRTALLRELVDAPDLTVTEGPEIFVRGRLVRALVTNNDGRSRSLRASVVYAEGLHGPETPWPLPWRHDGSPVHRLMPGASEMLDLAKFLGPAATIWVRTDGTNERISNYCEHDDTVRIRFKIWDVETGQLAADHTMLIEEASGRARFRLEDPPLPT